MRKVPTNGTGARGDLEIAVAETVARWRAGSLELPDYCLVLEPTRLTPTRQHWFLGCLRERAPARVVPVDAVAEVMRATLRGLRAGRWWPDLDRFLTSLEQTVPDVVGTPADHTDAAGGAELIRGP